MFVKSGKVDVETQTDACQMTFKKGGGNEQTQNSRRKILRLYYM